MIRALVHQGRVEIQDPLPVEWEGQFVKILPLTPDDPLPDLEERLAALRALGMMDEPDVPLELQDELAAWQQSSADALTLVEQLAQESEADEKG